MPTLREVNEALFELHNMPDYIRGDFALPNIRVYFSVNNIPVTMLIDGCDDYDAEDVETGDSESGPTNVPEDIAKVKA